MKTKLLIRFLIDEERTHTATLYNPQEGLSHGVNVLRGIQNIQGTFVERSIPSDNIISREVQQTSKREQRALARRL